MLSRCSDKVGFFFLIHDVKNHVIVWRTSGFISAVERGSNGDTSLRHRHCSGVPVQCTMVHRDGYFLSSCSEVRVDDQGGVISVCSLDVQYIYIACIISTINTATILWKINIVINRELALDFWGESFSYMEFSKFSQRLSFDMFQIGKKICFQFFQSFFKKKIF